MKTKNCRRRFLKDCAKLGGACGAFLACRGLLPASTKMIQARYRTQPDAMIKEIKA